MTTLNIEPYEIPAAELGPENPLPLFGADSDDVEVSTDDSVPESDRRYLGRGIGNRVLPYRMLDAYTRERPLRTFRTAVLENRWLRAVFGPEIGGRLLSLVHKPTGRELLERNPVFQPANVALRNAWISGGVEWNTSQLGHYFLTVSPVFAARVNASDGYPVLRIYEWDRLKAFPWQIDFHLPPDSPFLFAHPRIVNPHDHELAMYWWSNIAVTEHPERRTLVPAADALSHPPGAGVLAVLPLPEPAGFDVTYPTNAPAAGEAFFRIPDERRKWVAQVDREGKGLFHLSTDRLRGRKMFFWGMNPGGRRWQDHLSVPGRAYIELQGGLARTQLETLPMPALARWEWTEVYGLLDIDPDIAHGPDWERAWRAADARIDDLLPRERLDALHDGFARDAATGPEEILTRGAGWGALERRRLARHGIPDGIPAELGFGSADIGADEAPWLALLEEGALPERDPRDGPGHYMVQREWRELLEQALAAGRGDHWLSWLHVGVMRMEAREHDAARAAWERSLERAPNAWALRNLAVLEQRAQRPEAACALLEQAWTIGPHVRAIAEEYAQALVDLDRHADALAFIDTLPEDIRRHDRLLLALAKAALHTGDFEHVEGIFCHEFAHVRECETSLTDLWFAFHERRLAEIEGRPIDDDIRARARRECPPPSNIDFRMRAE